MGEVPEMGELPEMGGSSDVLLVYTDDDYDSYANIFDNAKTDVSNADKDRLIDALQALGEGGDVSDCVDIESEEHTELYHAAFAEFIESVFTSGEFERLFDETVELISPYVERDPTKFCTYEEFELGAETLREFCLLRAESIGYQLAGEDVTVDASGLDIFAMGSMNNTAGGGGRASAAEHKTAPPSLKARRGLVMRLNIQVTRLVRGGEDGLMSWCI
ncbi:MAG: CotH kinase family protein [Lachnospiraceae bacterium]